MVYTSCIVSSTTHCKTSAGDEEKFKFFADQVLFAGAAETLDDLDCPGQFAAVQLEVFEDVVVPNVSIV